MELNRFKACAPPHCQCPEIEIIDGERVCISDDFNGIVVMTQAEFEMIIEWYNRQLKPNVPIPPPAADLASGYR